MKIVVNEIFQSIQGEGPGTGKPSVFIRLGGCNLTCRWCDSKFAWHTKYQDNHVMSVETVIDRIKSYPCNHLVITGGEPLLQQKEIEVILKKLPNHTAELETNGSITCDIKKHLTQINCSPKLSGSGNKPYPLRIKPTNKKVIFKFVVSKKSDLNEIDQYVRKYKIPKSKAYLMPEGVEKSGIEKRSKWLVELCKKEGYNFTTRLHILLYGNQRKK
ncbi:7-carboxy-7-deazaguanine synthase [Candidatus Peregrinibacteria bacterium CG_4_10_14_0_2_um_filter_43_11]|nr:MAG: 7-carboxy-7-deazaguanine synthase [Candidatus Peregrinibacteria bacterium CG_4_10_14_0_2_um_filter_43_11]